MDSRLIGSNQMNRLAENHHQYIFCSRFKPNFVVVLFFIISQQMSAFFPICHFIIAEKA